MRGSPDIHQEHGVRATYQFLVTLEPDRVRQRAAEVGRVLLRTDARGAEAPNLQSDTFRGLYVLVDPNLGRRPVWTRGLGTITY